MLVSFFEGILLRREIRKKQVQNIACAFNMNTLYQYKLSIFQTEGAKT
jgi:hypothetical protein